MSRKKGFTLIELLVVIAIIAILAAILFPVFSRARARARAAVCLSNMKQIALAFVMYSQDYDEKTCLAFVTLNAAANSANRFTDAWGNVWYSDYFAWQQALMPYTADKSSMIFACPEAPGSDPSPKSVVNLNYGINLTIANGVPLARIQNPADVLAVVDCGRYGFTWSYVYRGPTSSKWYIPNDPRPACALESWCARDKRHFGTNVHVAFADGHAKSMTSSAVNTNDRLWCPNGATGNACNTW